MLYCPWYNKETDLLGGYDTYQEHYSNIRSVVNANESKYTVANVDDIDYDIEGFPEHAWDHLAPSTQEGQVGSNAQGREDLRDMSQEDLLDNAALLGQRENVGAVQSRYESSPNADE